MMRNSHSASDVVRAFGGLAHPCPYGLRHPPFSQSARKGWGSLAASPRSFAVRKFLGFIWWAAPPLRLSQGWEDWAGRGIHTLWTSDLHFRGLLFIYQNWTGLVIGVVSKTAPRPLLWFQHQSARYWVAVDVAEFFQPFRVDPDYEIIKSPLPHVSFGEHFIPEFALGRAAMSLQPLEKLVREALLQHLHHGRWRALLRLADQQMEVFRHHDISDYDKTVAAADLLEGFEKQASTGGGSQHGTAVITTRSDEMQVAAAVASLETFRHSWRVDLRWQKRCDG